METSQSQSWLRRVLLADAVVSGATGALMAGGAPFLTELLALPEPLLRYAGLFLLPYAAFVAVVATRKHLQPVAVWAIIIINALWALDSIVLLFTGWAAPNLLGYSFVIFQAVVVAL
ncbi:MAG: hypothetical protein HC893_06490 [Chloroflexaceae bacterium]|nr:hypothetical protein [Chloroflexaceae bacterium]NJL33562.1 hypothetical protein [Chloroflexaceae bacterium]NJO07624.1 hypothetical protein [Chloroflexaceae bacterium]